MSDDLKKLIEAARTRTISADELQAQRRSFAYGNTKIENDRVTREMVDAFLSERRWRGNVRLGAPQSRFWR